MSLVNFVLMEFNKVKGTRTFLITVIGALLVPLLQTIIQLVSGGGVLIDSLNDEYSIYLTLFSIIFTAIIINYLFTVDIETHTLKSIIPIPISRNEYIAGKLITLLLWMIILALITIAASFILFPLSGMRGFDLNPILIGAFNYLIGTILLFLAMIPIAFITVFTKNTSAGLVISVFIVFLNLLGRKELAYNPWILPSKIAFEPGNINLMLACGIIIVVAIISYILLRQTFNKRDIPL